MNNLEKRINELEIKFSYQDDLLNELNLIVANQQVKIKEMSEVIQAISAQTANSGGQGSNPKNERPPHY